MGYEYRTDGAYNVRNVFTPQNRSWSYFSQRIDGLLTILLHSLRDVARICQVFSCCSLFQILRRNQKILPQLRVPDSANGSKSVSARWFSRTYLIWFRRLSGTLRIPEIWSIAWDCGLGFVPPDCSIGRIFWGLSCHRIPLRRHDATTVHICTKCLYFPYIPICHFRIMAHPVCSIISYKWVRQEDISLYLDFLEAQLRSLRLVDNALTSHPLCIISHLVFVWGHRSER